MRSAVTSLIKNGLHEIDFYHRRLRHDRFPGVAVLAYHGVRTDEVVCRQQPFKTLHVTAQQLDSHCRLLRETCHPISLAEWRSVQRGEAVLPHRPVLVTFDDGYRSVLRYAIPILRRHGIPAVVFVCSGPIEERCYFWFDAVARKKGEEAVEKMKDLPFDEWRSVCMHDSEFREDDSAAPLDFQELVDLSVEPGIEIGSHTASHPILARAPRAIQYHQIVDDKARLEEWTGRPVTSFAYPNGRPGQDYTRETVNLLAETGFTFAFTTQPGFATADEARLEHSRFLMLSGVSDAELAHRLTFSWRR